MTRIDSASRRLTRIGVFYDVSYFTNVNKYYTYTYPRRSRLNLGGLHDVVRRQVSEGEGVPLGYCTARSWIRTGSGAGRPQPHSRINRSSPSGCGTKT